MTKAELLPASIAASVVLLASCLPVQAGCFALLALIIVLGVPHGALDGEIARDLLAPRFGRLWFPVFSAPYLAVSAGVLLAWHAAPVVTLAVFLGASVWHFGTEDARPGDLIEAMVLGGLPVAVPSLVHPHATLALLGGMTGMRDATGMGGNLPPWFADGLATSALGWCGLAVLWLAFDARGAAILRAAALVALFVVLTPLAAFAVYFVAIHAPSHTRALIADPRRGVRVRDAGSAMIRALPLTAMTVLIGAAIWPLYAGAPSTRLLALTFQILAALTLPHMILDAIVARATAGPRIPTLRPGMARQAG